MSGPERQAGVYQIAKNQNSRFFHAFFFFNSRHFKISNFWDKNNYIRLDSSEPRLSFEAAT